MKTKWYLGFFIAFIALFVVSQQQINTPNQEIVLQFSNKTVSKNHSENTILKVTQQLKNIGVTNINVTQTQDKYYKITYYSNSSVTNIKKALALLHKVELNLPVSNNKKYNLSVFKIENKKKSSGIGDSKCVFDLKQESTRFFNPNINTSGLIVPIKKQGSYKQTTIKTKNNNRLKPKNNSYNIPEVRAGPIS